MRNKSPWIKYGFLAFVVLVTAAFLFLDPILRSGVKRDMKGAIPQTAVATVAILVLPDRLHSEGPAVPKVSVRFHGALYPAANAYTAEALKIDGPAQIEYRVGKSGRIVVDSVEPLPPARP